MYWKNLPKDMRRIFCCPLCHGDMVENYSNLTCEVCGGEFLFIGGSVPCFAPSVYESPQAKTVRINTTGKIRQSLFYQMARDSLSRIRTLLNHLVLRDEGFWETQLDIFRNIEDGVVTGILASNLCLPVGLTLELGVGHRDKSKFYNRVTENLICSDIFYDEGVCAHYKSSPKTIYCVINSSQLPLRGSSVDLLLTSHVIEHFPDRQLAFKNIWNILKPGGWACHVVPTAPVHVYRHLRSLITNLLTLTPRFLGGIHGEYDSVCDELELNTISSWRNLFTTHGFQVVADAPGKVFPMRPFNAVMSLKISRIFHLYGSHVFLMRKTCP